MSMQSKFSWNIFRPTKIRDRLAGMLLLASFLVIAVLSTIVYFFTARFHEQEFYSRLEERVELTELIFLENDKELEQTVRDRFLQTLDEELEYAIPFSAVGKDSLNQLFLPDFAQKIEDQAVVRFKQGDRYGLGRKYSLPKGDFVVVVTAEDTFGQRKLNFLKNVLSWGGLCAGLLLVIVGRFGLERALMPLENKIRRASAISAERLDLRLNVENPEDEIGRVSLAFNGMLDRLQDAFEAQRLFVRHASHEMKNPLTAIGGEAEVLLQKTRSAEEYQDALRVVLKESNKLQALINQLLSLEKTEAMAILPNPMNFSLDHCLLEVIEQFPADRMQLDFQPKEGENLLKGNPHLLGTAFQNLIDNALKYSGDKPVKVSFACKGTDYNIQVIDQGIGIPASDLNRIYQPFFRSSNVLGHKGHGIGLALVKKIVELHKGGINVSSTPGEGTIVNLILPSGCSN